MERKKGGKGKKKEKKKKGIHVEKERK